MSVRRYRPFRYAALRRLLLLSAACLLLSCGPTYNSELVIQACLDQDGNRLPPGVTVSVDGASETWSGSPLRFPLHVEDEVRLVKVHAEASDDFVFNAKTEYAVQPGPPTSIELHFFRTYTITVEAVGREMARLSGVDVYANNMPIGTTDGRGRFIWRIDQPSTQAGIARAGTRFTLRLERNGETAEVPPVMLESNQFAYTAEAYLDQERISPYSGLAPDAETTVPDDDEDLLGEEATLLDEEETLLGEEETPAEPPPIAEAPEPTREEAPPPAPPPADSSAAVINNEPPTEPETVTLVPEDVPVQTTASFMQQADEAFAKEQYEEAARLYSRIPPDSPDYMQALVRIGKIYLDAKNFEGAVAAFETIIQNDPSEYAAYNNLAAVYLATESYGKALSNLDQVLARKHLIPRAQRREAELDVRYTRAAIHYLQFQHENDKVTKREQGLLAMGVIQYFIDRVPPDNAAFAKRRLEMEDKLNDIRTWIRTQ